MNLGVHFVTVRLVAEDENVPFPKGFVYIFVLYIWETKEAKAHPVL
jgi:hypothetical protein